MDEPALSPIRNEALEAAAARVATLHRVVRKRAPREVNRRVREIMERIYDVVHRGAEVVADVEPGAGRAADGPADPPPSAEEEAPTQPDRPATTGERIALVRELEDLTAELRGQKAFVAQFYQDGRLAVVRAYDPIRIRGAVDHRRIEEQFERYLARAERTVARVAYFLERAGVAAEDAPELKPWQKPYAALEEYHELLWGKIDRSATLPPDGRSS